MRKEFTSKSENPHVNINMIDLNGVDEENSNIRLRNFANNEDLEDMDIYNQEEKKAKLDEQYLNMAKGGRMKNLKNIKKNIDVQQSD